MKALIQYFGRLRLLALLLTLLPLAALPLAGTVWLWQTGHLAHWLLLVAGCGTLAFGLHLWTRYRDRHRPPGAVTGANPHWPALAEGAWLKVETLAAAAEPQDYSLSDGGALWRLARHTLEAVAKQFHPQEEQPLLALTVPHTLLIIERASRELREQVVHSLPLSHRLTLGNLVRARHWQQTAARYHDLYRAGRAIFNPASAVYKELSRAVGAQIMDFGSERLQRWLLQEYVRKVGFYAIELYSGNLLLNAAPVGDADNPVRLLVLGRAGSGKSSLIQTLAGGTLDATAAQSDGPLIGHRLHLPDWGDLQVWDTPAWDKLPRRHARRAVAQADLIVWVSRACATDTDADASQLRRLERWLGERAGQPEPPLLVAWNPADATQQTTTSSATQAATGDLSANGTDLHDSNPHDTDIHDIARRLGVPPENILQVSLAQPLSANTAEPLRRALDLCRTRATRSQYWRQMHQRKSHENRQLAGQQLRHLGSNAWKLARRFLRRDDR